MTLAGNLSRVLFLLVFAAAALAASVWLATPIAADGLIESEPHAGQTIGETPHLILLTFDQDLASEPGANSVAIVDADGVRVDDRSAEISGYSARSMIVRVAGGVEAEGDLTVVWVVRFAGQREDTQGSFVFSVQPGAEPVEELEAAAEPFEERSEQSIVLWTIAILLAIAVAVLMLYYLRVATGNATSSLDGGHDSSSDDHH